MDPQKHYADLEDRMRKDFSDVLHSDPHWYSEPAREANDEMLSTLATTIADHKAAKTQG